MSDYYREPIDEKYEIVVEDSGKVSITRNGEDWITDPLAAKAWIAVADRFEREQESWANAGSTMNPEEYLEASRQIAKQLTETWGWLPDEPEALRLADNLAGILHLAVEGTRTRPLVFLEALLKGKA